MGLNEDPDEEGGAKQRPRILLGLTGSVAAIKASEIIDLLATFGTVKVATTASAAHFCDTDAIRAKGHEVFGDQDDWRLWEKKGDPVLHIDLRKWADILVVAPLSANTMAKMAHGLCDNLLTCVIRAWDFNKPILVAPAMNTHMWDSPFTKRQVESLQQMGVKVMMPISKTLACGDIGQGALPDPHEIVDTCKSLLDAKGA